jgi:hypothetical protein
MFVKGAIGADAMAKGNVNVKVLNHGLQDGTDLPGKRGF